MYLQSLLRMGGLEYICPALDRSLTVVRIGFSRGRDGLFTALRHRLHAPSLSTHAWG